MYSGEQTMRSTTTGMATEIRIKGKDQYVPSALIDGRTVIATGKWLKKAAIHDEELLEGMTVRDPESFVAQLRQTGLNADLFTFAQQLPDTTPKYSYPLEWDNLAVIPITTYSNWLKNQVESSVPRAVRKAAKLGVVVKLAELDETFVNGIVGINNETPIRQGMVFWHYQKSPDAVKRENSTYADRNIFLGAYLGDELIGFMRLTCVGGVANILQILTMMKHFDKRPANALIAKAVEVCEQKGMSHLTYCNYTYKDPKSTLTEFKRRNGFEKVLLPRYFIPLTWNGKMALRLNLHHGLAAQIPQPVVRQLLKIRSFWYGRILKTVTETAKETA
jgi:hypothetical protein